MSDESAPSRRRPRASGDHRGRAALGRRPATHPQRGPRPRGPPLLAVADGLGGQRAGEVAAVDRHRGAGEDPRQPLARQRCGPRPRRPTGRFAGWRDAARSEPEWEPRSPRRCSSHGRIWVAHVGDSRGVPAARRRAATTDKRPLGGRGLVSPRRHRLPDEAERHPQRNVITRALGAEPVVHVDRRGVEAQPGDLMLLCSDGLTALVSGHDDPPRSCSARTTSTSPPVR